MTKFTAIPVAALAVALSACTATPVADIGSPPDRTDDPAPLVDPANTAAHTDPVDSFDDLSWVGESGTNLRVLLTDAPLEIDSVVVSLCEVAVERLDAPEAERWVALSDTCQDIDLLTLRDGITEAIALGTLPPGEYGQIRLILERAEVVVEGLEFELEIPSAMKSGIKIVGGFSVVEGEITTLLIDFDAAESIRERGRRGFMMSPVIALVDMVRDRVGDAGEPDDAAEPEDGDGEPDDAAEPEDGDGEPDDAAEPEDEEPRE